MAINKQLEWISAGEGFSAKFANENLGAVYPVDGVWTFYYGEPAPRPCFETIEAAKEAFEELVMSLTPFACRECGNEYYSYDRAGRCVDCDKSIATGQTFRL